MISSKIKIKTQSRTRVSLEDYAANYRNMIALLKEKKIGCLIVIPPADIRQGYMFSYKPRVLILRRVAEEFSVPVIEPDSLFIAWPKKCFLADGFHLTALGNTLVAKTIVSAVKEHYKRIIGN